MVGQDFQDKVAIIIKRKENSGDLFLTIPDWRDYFIIHLIKDKKDKCENKTSRRSQFIALHYKAKNINLI